MKRDEEKQEEGDREKREEENGRSSTHSTKRVDDWSVRLPS